MTFLPTAALTLLLACTPAREPAAPPPAEAPPPQQNAVRQPDTRPGPANNQPAGNASGTVPAPELLAATLSGGAPYAAAPAPPWPDLSLSGRWHGERGAITLPEPEPLSPFTATRTVTLPADWPPGGAAVLHGEATGWRVTVAVNGAEVGSVAGGIHPLSIDLSGYLRPGDNELSLAFAASSPDSVIAGREVERVSQWTSGVPGPGQVLARGDLWLSFPGGPEALAVSLEGGELVVSARVDAPEGTPVRFEVVRDGRVIQALPEAAVGPDGRAQSRAPWQGSLWAPGGDHALQYLVVRAGGRERQLRFGARELAVSGGRLTINGAPTYLASLRYLPEEATPREGVGELAGWLAVTGGNTLEVHGAAAPGEVFDAADELGLMVVEMPRCEGEARKDGPPPRDDAMAGFVHAAALSVAQARAGHPSLVIRSLEGGFRHGGYGDDVPQIEGRMTSGMDERNAPEASARGQLTPHLNELPWRLSRDSPLIAERLGPLLEAHRAGGLGMALPHISTPHLAQELGDQRLREEALALSALLAKNDVTPLALGERRGVATVEVRVTRGGAPAEGVPVLLVAPSQAPVGAVSDAAGRARLTLDYRGPAEVKTLDGAASQALTLEPGRWEAGRWKAGAAGATLELP